MWKDHLAIYLNDHLGGSVAAVESLEHLEAEAPDLAPELAKLRREIEKDRQELMTVMEQWGVELSTTRRVGGWLAEKLTQIKAKIDDHSGSALHVLEGIEIVALGIHGKWALWTALQAASEVSPELRGPDYESLAHRALEQRRKIENLRLDAAKGAFNHAA